MRRILTRLVNSSCAAVAARVRDAGLVAAGRPATVTYSPKVFVPVTRLCRDKCHYCTFVTTPGQLRAEALRLADVMELTVDASTSVDGNFARDLRAVL